jgi:hypothetical protein
MALAPIVAFDRRVLIRWLGAALLAGAPAVAGIAETRDARDRSIQRLSFNLLANSVLASRATTDNVAIPQWLAVADATDADPIELTTTIPHGLATGDQVLVKGVLGNAAANGWWTVTVTGDKKLTLDGSAGSGAYTAGGAIFPAAGQPAPPAGSDSAGDLPWTPWFSFPAAATATEFFQGTGEVYTLPGARPASSFLAQDVDGSLFRPGEHLCLSVEARMPERAGGDQRLRMLVTAAMGTTHVYSATFPASFLTPVYQRLSLCFQLENAIVPDAGVLRVEFIDEYTQGARTPMYWTRPMLNEGFLPEPWTPFVQPMPRTHPFY